MKDVTAEDFLNLQIYIQESYAQYFRNLTRTKLSANSQDIFVLKASWRQQLLAVFTTLHILFHCLQLFTSFIFLYFSIHLFPPILLIALIHCHGLTFLLIDSTENVKTCKRLFVLLMDDESIRIALTYVKYTNWYNNFIDICLSCSIFSHLHISSSSIFASTCSAEKIKRLTQNLAQFVISTNNWINKCLLKKKKIKGLEKNVPSTLCNHLSSSSSAFSFCSTFLCAFPFDKLVCHVWSSFIRWWLN